MFKRKGIHQGQAALIMVLIMTVVSAIAVSVAGRSTVETRIQEMSVQNREALLLAQTGLEDAIFKNAGVSDPAIVDGRGYDVTVGDAGSDGITTDKINSGDAFEVNLVGANITEIKVYWKKATSTGNPSMFITDIRDTESYDFAFDSDADETDGFTSVLAGGTFNGKNYDYVASVPVGLNSEKLRITVLGSPAFLGVEPVVGGPLPAQFTDYRSVSNISSGETTVKYGIEYKESKVMQIPSVFDYALFTKGTIIQ